MPTLLLTHPSALAHDMGAGHPEQPGRLRAVLQALEAPAFAGLVRGEAPQASLEALLRVHPGAYVEALADAAPRTGLVRIDGDTAMNPGTWPACLHAAGGAVRATDAVMTGEAGNAFLAMRPPGHHAEPAVAMGFCFLNSVAVAARHAQAAHGAERVAIVDFDVHHGNGTQAIFWDDPTVLYASTHQMPLFPGTGARSERGAHGQIVNAPLAAGDGGERFREAMRDTVLPRVEAFAPDLLIVSAGFDAHVDDPLANIRLNEEDFAWATRELLALARRRCGGRLVSVLEGGYDLQALGRSAAAHVAALMQGA